MALKRENPERTAAQIVRIMRAQSGWAPSERTLQRHFERLELDRDLNPGPLQVSAGSRLIGHRTLTSLSDGPSSGYVASRGTLPSTRFPTVPTRQCHQPMPSGVVLVCP